MIPPATPLNTVPPAPTPADEKQAQLGMERDNQRRYGNKGRASTVLTGQGAGSTLG